MHIQYAICMDESVANVTLWPFHIVFFFKVNTYYIIHSIRPSTIGRCMGTWKKKIIRLLSMRCIGMCLVSSFLCVFSCLLINSTEEKNAINFFPLGTCPSQNWRQFVTSEKSEKIHWWNDKIIETNAQHFRYIFEYISQSDKFISIFPMLFILHSATFFRFLVWFDFGIWWRTVCDNSSDY